MSEIDYNGLKDEGSCGKDDNRARIGGDPEGWSTSRTLFEPELTLQVQESRTRPKARSLKTQCHSFFLILPAEVVCRPRHHRIAVTASNACWEFIKINGKNSSSEGGLVRLLAEAWLADDCIPSLQDVIITYRGKKGRTKGKRKKVCGGQRTIAR